jgi:excisionase family DNA binding protein
MSQFLTAKDIATLLKISKALAYRLIANGDIKSVRFGRTVRVSQESLEAFLSDKSTIERGDGNLIQVPTSTNRVKV